MLEGFSLGSYLLLVDYTGRLFRDGQGRDLGRAVGDPRPARQRPRISWWSRLEKLSKGRLLGRFFAASRERLREAARAGRAPPGESGRMPGAMKRHASSFDYPILVTG